jgi:hypothetical protein
MNTIPNSLDCDLARKTVRRASETASGLAMWAATLYRWCAGRRAMD